MEKDKIQPQKHNIHKVLAHSYSTYFILFLVGVVLDLIFKIRIFTNPVVIPMGVVLLILGSILILWAQYTSRNLKKENISKETFCHGPYCYTRGPTNLGLLFLILGFGIIVNAFFVVFLAFISFILGKFVFLDKQEKLLAEKYGDPYLEYKKSVKF